MVPMQGSMDLIPGGGTAIPQPVRCGQKEKKKSDQTRILFSFYMQTQIQNNS